MRKATMVLCLFLVLATMYCGNKPEEIKSLDTKEQKTSYAVGYDMGKSLKNFATELDLDALAAGIKAAVNNEKTPMKEEEMAAILNQFWQGMRLKEETKMKVTAEKNKAEGDAFLAENAKNPGVKVTASGLQYMAVKEGTGPVPVLDDKVKVHYKGTFIDGNTFDSSYKRGVPAEFPLKGVIKGWTEGLQLMKTGSIYKFFVPSALAYGERGAADVIGPNAVLIFEVELLGILPPQGK